METTSVSCRNAVASCESGETAQCSHTSRSCKAFWREIRYHNGINWKIKSNAFLDYLASRHCCIPEGLLTAWLAGPRLQTHPNPFRFHASTPDISKCTTHERASGAWSKSCYWGYMNNGKENGNYYNILGICGDNGK